MKVTLVSTYSGRRLHIRSDICSGFTLCGAAPERVLWTQYELTDAEPSIAGLTGLCKVCRKNALQVEKEVSDK